MQDYIRWTAKLLAQLLGAKPTELLIDVQTHAMAAGSLDILVAVAIFIAVIASNRPTNRVSELVDATNPTP